MAIDLGDFNARVRAAVSAFWESRESARQRQQESGTKDQGERSGVTAGKNMNGFLTLIEEIVRINGLPAAEIHQSRPFFTLPGYFRATKQWDLLVTNNGRLIAAIELKSHVGPSFGNNFNNRTEEAIGTAVDLWTTFREGAFGENPRPFVGWLMLVEDCQASRDPVNVDEPHFAVFPEFSGASYAERYSILCRKLVQERLYTATALLLSPRNAATTGDFSGLSEMTSVRSFMASLAGHVAGESGR